MLNVNLIDKIRNEEIYKRSHETPITTEVKKRRLIWFGHMLGLSEGTPAKMDKNSDKGNVLSRTEEAKMRRRKKKKKKKKKKKNCINIST